MMISMLHIRLARVILLWILCPLVSVATFRVIFGGVATTMPDFVYHAELRPVAFFSHIFMSSLALALIPLQFSDKIRYKYLRWHRIIGRIYVYSIVIGGVSGLTLAVTTEAGRIAGAGFSALAVVWLVTTLYAALMAMRRRLAEHRRWMIRSAALTMAAVSLRIMLVATAVADVPFDALYGAISWACWIPNLLVAEFIVRQVDRRIRISPQ